MVKRWSYVQKVSQKIPVCVSFVGDHLASKFAHLCNKSVSHICVWDWLMAQWITNLSFGQYCHTALVTSKVYSSREISSVNPALKTPSTSHSIDIYPQRHNFECLQIWAENTEKKILPMQTKIHYRSIKFVFPAVFSALLFPPSLSHHEVQN